MAILNFDVILNIRQMNIHIEMDQGVKKLGPHNIDSKFLILEILGQYYEGHAEVVRKNMPECARNGFCRILS